MEFFYESSAFIHRFRHFTELYVWLCQFDIVRGRETEFFDEIVRS